VLIATENSFNGGPESWYSDPYRNDQPHYHDSTAFADRAAVVRGRFATGKVLIAGCGYGYLVKHLVGLGVDAYGADASDWCVSQAATVAHNRVLKADITNRAQLTSALTFAGLRTNGRFTAIVTEDVLTCLTDAEITLALSELRRISQVLFHIVTAVETEADRLPEFNWKTLEAWKALVGTDNILGLESYQVL
jgi:2-polyprenyl-3-methyl-5-hydroxy-6-metoxy-1,4-benzoquinol methylase